MKFNKERLTMLYDQLPLPAIMKLRHTSRYFYHTANNYVSKRVASLIHRFRLSYGRTLKKLDTYDVVIGGWVALLPILSCISSFDPHHLDIYVSEHHAFELYQDLLEDEYQVSETWSNVHLGNPCISGVLLLTHRSNRDLCVNLIKTSSPSPVAAIIHSSSTIQSSHPTNLPIQLSALHDPTYWIYIALLLEIWFLNSSNAIFWTHSILSFAKDIENAVFRLMTISGHMFAPSMLRVLILQDTRAIQTAYSSPLTNTWLSQLLLMR